MSITKESKEWTQALALVPNEWKPETSCYRDQHLLRRKVDLKFLWQCGCGMEFSQSAAPDHFMPPPDISPDLLYSILEVMVTKYRTMQAIDWEMNFEGRSFRDAIIRAAASLQEAK